MFENLRKLYFLVQPYGRKKLAILAAMTILQGIVQTIGVTSIFPFLVVASDPSTFRNTPIVAQILSYLPELSDQELLMVVGSAAVGMLAIANAVNLITVYSTARYTYGFGQWIRVQLLKEIISRDYRYFLQMSSGILLKKINNDAQTIISSVLMPFLQAIAGGLNISLLAGTLIWINPWVAIASSLGLGGAYILIFGLLNSHRRSFSEVMLATSRGANRLVHQILAAIKPLKVHGVEAEFSEKFEELVSKAAKYQAKQSIYNLAPKNIVEPFALVTLISIVIIYSYRGFNLAEILPMLGLMAMAAYKLLPNIQMMYSAATTYSSNIHALDEVYEEFKQSNKTYYKYFSGHKTERFKLSRQIHLENLSFSYPSSAINVIDSLNLTLPAFTSLALVGTTGCGKSTLVDLILGLHTPTQGRILVDEVELGPSNRRQWQNSIGYVPQDIVLLDDTIAANIALGKKTSEIDWLQMKRSCEAAQILEFIEEQLPERWQTEVGERGVRLSGGQRQRLGIARALYHKPDLLILDEATSALDNETETGVMEAIKNLEGKITMIIIAHRLSTIQWCDQVIDLTRGNKPKPTPIS